MPITNPWKHVAEEDSQRLNSKVPTEVIRHLNAIYPEHGFKQALVNRFLETFINDLKRNDIEHYTGQDTIDAVERIISERLGVGAITQFTE